MNTFTGGSGIGFGWDTFKKRPWFFIGATLLYFCRYWHRDERAQRTGSSQGGLLALLGTLARLAVQMACPAWESISFLRLRRTTTSNTFRSQTSGHPCARSGNTPAPLFCSLSSWLSGLVLVIIPGIVSWGIMFGYSMYLIIDKQMWPMDALKESKRITYGYKWELLLLAFFSALIVIVGVICLGVGLLVAYPIVIIANTHAFRTLQSKAGATPSVA